MDSNPVVDIDTDKDVLLLLFLLKIWDNNYSQLIVAITKTHTIVEKLAKSSREKTKTKHLRYFLVLDSLNQTTLIALLDDDWELKGRCFNLDIHEGIYKFQRIFTIV